jgi:hypothetical protein
MISVFEIYFNQSLKCQKILTKNSARTSLCSMYLQSCFTGKHYFSMLCVKKIKFGAKIDIAQDIFFVFFTQDTKEYWFSTKLVMCT